MSAVAYAMRYSTGRMRRNGGEDKNEYRDDCIRLRWDIPKN